MARKLLVLAAASVVLLVYLVGRGEAPAVQCTDPTRSDCIAVAEGRGDGPGNLPHPRGQIRLRRAGRQECTSARAASARAGIVRASIARQDFGLPIPLRFRRLPDAGAPSPRGCSSRHRRRPGCAWTRHRPTHRR